MSVGVSKISILKEVSSVAACYLLLLVDITVSVRIDDVADLRSLA